MSVTKAVITAAGFGSRFLPITKSIPKEMLPLIDKPIIHHLVDECAQANIEEVLIVASPGEVAKFEDYFYGQAINIRTLMMRQHKLERWNKVEKVFQLPKITIVPQDESLPYGNGRPILTVKDLLLHEQAFVVMFGDDVVIGKQSAVAQLLEIYNNRPTDGLIAVQEVPQDQVSKYGIVNPGKEDRVESVIEKPPIKDAPSNLVSYGRFIFTPKIFEYLSAESTGKDGEIWLQDANNQLSHHGDVRYTKITGNWMTTGDPLTYLQTHISMALQDQSIGKDIREFLRTQLSRK